MDADARRAVGKTALVVGALGVVFGDIGTSPIYTIQTAFDRGDPHPIEASLESVYGVVSLIFWSVTLIVTVKYVGLVMRADNDGEGGTMALILGILTGLVVVALFAVGVNVLPIRPTATAGEALAFALSAAGAYVGLRL